MPTPDTTTTATATSPEGGTATATATKIVKPGYKTTEGWFTAIAMSISMLYAMGVVSPEGTSSIAKAIALIAGVIATMGYSVSRGMAKK